MGVMPTSGHKMSAVKKRAITTSLRSVSYQGFHHCCFIWIPWLPFQMLPLPALFQVWYSHPHQGHDPKWDQMPLSHPVTCSLLHYHRMTYKLKNNLFIHQSYQNWSSDNNVFIPITNSSHRGQGWIVVNTEYYAGNIWFLLEGKVMGDVWERDWKGFVYICVYACWYVCFPSFVQIGYH